MIIREISFENFRPYRGMFDVKISSSEKNVTLINGENGQGKTSFFTGLNWCLYGDAALPKSGLGDKELVNKGMLFDSNTGEKIVTSVTMRFSRFEKHYIVHRSKTVSKKGKPGTLDYTVVDDDFYIQDLDVGVKKYYGESAQEILNVILPENVRTYFFFDGEQVNAFAEAKPEEIGLAVRNILKLDLITRAKEHLGIVSKELQTEAKPNISSELQDLLSKQEEIGRQRDEKLALKEQTKTELESCRALIRDLTEEYDSVKEIEAQMIRKKMLKDQLDDLENEKEAVRKGLKSLLAKSYRVFAHSTFKDAKQFLGKTTQDIGQDSRAIHQVAKKIIKDHHCMFCDRDTNKEDETRLFSMITTETSTQFEYSDIMRLSSDIEDSIHDQRRTYRDLTEQYKKYREISDKTEKVKQSIKLIDEEFLNSPYDNVKQLSQKRDRCIQEEVRLEMVIKTLDDEIETLKRTFNDLVDDRNKRSQLAEEARLKLDQSDLAEKCVQELETIFEQFAEQMRLRIQEETTDIFSAMMLKKQQFERVELDEKYILSLIDRYGDKNSRIDISAAESQILGLSFILGLARVSECGAPLVIDTPFGRFSERLKRNVLHQLPELVPQLILFVTDSEIGEEEHAILAQNVEYEYTLVNNDETGATSIREGRHI